MTPRWLHHDASDYPASLRQHLDGDAPKSVASIGNIDVLAMKAVGLICSIQCPGSIILKTYDTIRELRDAGTTVIGGFHSPMEKECLSILLRGQSPIVMCPPRSLEGMQIRKEWRQPIDAGRLLILSQFPSTERRATAELAATRNSFVASLATTILIAHASAGGKVIKLAQQLLKKGRRVFTISDSENEPLLALGARGHDLLSERSADSSAGSR
jgi:predicted Rossmann fold nucleotide-binding protein DprA/Smf involved in DNA uptake